jgi:hypothetical protein
MIRGAGGRGSLRRALTIGAAVAVLVAGSASAAYAAFTALTASSGNAFGAGSVALSDNDGSGAMFSMPSVTPGATATSCIRVTYDGTLPADVRLYGTASGALAQYIDLTVTRGADSAGFGDCSGFQADPTDYTGAGAGVVFDGTLADYPTSWAGGLVDPAAVGGGETWTSSEAHDYRFRVTIRNAPGAWGQAATATFRWEARNT